MAMAPPSLAALRRLLVARMPAGTPPRCLLPSLSVDSGGYLVFHLDSCSPLKLLVRRHIRTWNQITWSYRGQYGIPRYRMNCHVISVRHLPPSYLLSCSFSPPWTIARKPRVKTHRPNLRCLISIVSQCYKYSVLGVFKRV